MSPEELPPHLSLNAIEALLKTQIIGRAKDWPNELWAKIDSTNARALLLASRGAPEGVIVLAREQTLGRGRLGSNWISPADSGVYASCILRPKQRMYELSIYTLAAGVACARAIYVCTGIQVGLKWVNDITYIGKKLGGILSEVATPNAPASIPALIIGIGVNLNHNEDSLPGELKEKMEWLGRITGQLVNPNLLVAAIAYELEAVCQTIAAGKHEDILSEWRKYSITLNKDIIAISGNKTITGKAEDIDSSGALLVRTNNGEIMRLSSAEISIRSLDGSYA